VARAVLIFLGGGAGSLARYGLSVALQRAAGTDLPLGTLTVNVLGSFAVGVIMTLSLERNLIGNELRIPLTVGFCGGFTTMSAFSFETLALMRGSGAPIALAYVAATLIACLAAVWLGYVLARPGV
jgi:CrcB protein